MSVTRRALARPLALSVIAALAVAILPGSAARPVAAVSPGVVISEVYGGGGNSGATLTNDFIELFNRGSSSVSLTGWSVQYASTTGTTWSRTDLTAVTLAPGQSYLVQEAQGAGGTTALPTPDATGTIAMSATNAKVVLLDTQTTIASGTVCPAGASVIDLIGYGTTTNCFEGSVTANLSNTTSAARTDRCVDTDSNVADFTIGSPAPQNTASALAPCSAADAAPSVISSTPADNATGVANNAALSITFGEPVVIESGAVSLACNGNPIAATVSGDPGTTFPITYLGTFPDGATCAIGVTATGVHDVDTDDPPDDMASNVSIDFTVAAADPCAGAFTPIPSIQGSGTAAAITGTVTTKGIVVGDYEGPSGSTLRGYYIQDAAGDGNAATSDGIFVFNSAAAGSVSLGDEVRVTGTAADFQDQTQISQSAVSVCSTGNTTTPTDIVFPVTAVAGLERYEGMLVRVPQTMSVTEHFQLGRFGQVVISSGGRLDTPTAVAAPGAPQAAVAADNLLRKVIVDDASQGQNPDPIVFGRGGQPLSASNTLRGGDTITDLTGVMTYTWAGNAASGNAYRIRPVGALGGAALFVAVNDRPGSTVEVSGNVRVAAMNLLNYFNSFSGCTNGVGGFPTGCRGAENATEFGRQVPKTVAAILGLDADVIGINEVENDGYGPTSAIHHLVDALNAEAGAGTYAFIDVDAATGEINALGLDAIKVGLIYRPAAVSLVGDTAALNSPAFVLGGDAVPPPTQPPLRSRPSLAQAFETLDGARFVVDVNHLKSKGSACDLPDQGDGQGNCNVVRTNSAHALVDWLAADPTGTGDEDILIMGDLNSYAMEDPIAVLTGADYTNLLADLEDPYSYVFDGGWGYLDYALASPTAADQVAGVVEWHIDADEPSVLDYNTNFKSAGQVASLYAPDRFRVSDHDPIVVGLDAATDRPTVDAGGPYLVEELGSVGLTATGSDPTGDTLTYAWDLDGDTAFETAGPTPTFFAGSMEAPQTVTVTVRVTDEHGQSSTDTATIDVIWDFGGFLPPSMPGGVTQINAGASHPVKFSLAGDQGLLVLGGDVMLQRHGCPGGSPLGSPLVAAQSESFSYDPLTDTYKFVWKTRKAWAGWCGTLSVPLADGQTYHLEVRFRA